MERLARALRDGGTAASLDVIFAPDRWRSLMRTRHGRFHARLAALLGFPLLSVARAVGSPGTVLVPTTNPFFLPALLVALRRLHGNPVVPLVYDLYPDALESTGYSKPSRLLSRVAESWNRYLFRHADGVVFIGSRMGDHARARYGTPRRWEVLETGADSREFALGNLEESPKSELEAWCAERTVAAYVGNLGLVHDWETLAKVIPRFLERNDGPRPMAFLIAATGPGVESLRRACEGLPGAVVRFEPPLADEIWARVLARSAISVVTLRPSAALTSIPSKTFSAMAAGNAILAIAPDGSDLADVVRDAACGEVIAPGDADAVEAILRKWASEPRSLRRLREKAKKAVESRYDIPRLAERWRAFLDEVCSGVPGVGGTGRLKRGTDLIVSMTVLFMSAPALAGVAVAVAAADGFPIFFEQERPGLGGRPFRLVKFRTMRASRPGEEGPDSDGARLTRLGRFLRATSFDELPTLWNVLRGDMSLVGPRPLLMRYLERYTPAQARRHEVKPGITGWAQVNGRNAVSWDDKLEMDVWYVDHRSFWLDAKILWKTCFKVLRREDISQAGHVTMPEFLGQKAHSV